MKICILVVSHNNKNLTDDLCENIISRTKGVDYDLHVIETGSEWDNCSKHMTLWVKEGVRMTRGFNLLKDYADFTAAMKGYYYDAYHLFVNDAKFIDDQDLVTTLYKQMISLPDCGQIHPYISNMGHTHPRQRCMNTDGPRKESFVEIICPMISGNAWLVNPDLLDNVFFYGWGLDYDIPYQLHKTGYRTYISDTVGIHHVAFTSYRERAITKEKLTQGEFIPLARKNMEEGFITKYGHNWKRIIYDGIPEDVNKESLYNWLNQNDGFVL